MLTALSVLAVAPGATHAGVLALPTGLCEQPPQLSPRQHDRLLQVVARLQQLMDQPPDGAEAGSSADAAALPAHPDHPADGPRPRTGPRNGPYTGLPTRAPTHPPVALVARAGTDLRRFGLQYSHAALAVPQGLGSPWAVRQLYYACDERRPRLFDQGLAGFLAGAPPQPAAQLMLVLPPPGAPAQALHDAVLDSARASRVLGADYSANAYPFSPRYQNCNQWVAELMALAWAAPPEGGPPAEPAPPPRAQAQQWLQAQGFAQPPLALGAPWWWLGAALSPLLHLDDHPEADRLHGQMQVATPEALADLVQRHLPGSRRLALCHTEQHLVLREGGPPLPEDCRPGPGDRVWPLD